jgi:hypothetical protein
VFSAEVVTHVRKVVHTISLASQRTMTKLGRLLAQRVDVYSAPDIWVPQNWHSAESCNYGER